MTALIGALAALVVLAGLFLVLRRKIMTRMRGYDIRFNGRAGLTSSDERGVVEVDGEMLVGDMRYIVYADRMKLVEPRASQVLDDAWRSQIIERIEKAVGVGKLEVRPRD